MVHCCCNFFKSSVIIIIIIIFSGSMEEFIIEELVASSSSSSSSSDDELPINLLNQQKKLSRVENFSEEIVPRMNDEEFKSHFRMFPRTFNHLLQMLDLTKGSSRERGTKISPRKQLEIVLWVLATPDSFRSVALTFGVATSTAWEIFEKGIKMIAALSPRVIKMPRREEFSNLASQFSKKANFPDVVGCIDGSHIDIKAPKDQPEAYINRKGKHSIVLQAVADDKMLFTDCYAGEVGSVHDARIFRRSKFGKELISRVAPYHVLGDKAYPLSSTMMTAFKDNGRLTAQQVKYNTALSKTRSVVERAFAALKGRFRRLKYVDMSRTDLIPTLIIASCVLHNICIRQNDDWEDIIEREEFNQRDNDNDDDDDNEVQDDEEGKAKRNALLARF